MTSLSACELVNHTILLISNNICHQACSHCVVFFGPCSSRCSFLLRFSGGSSYSLLVPPHHALLPWTLDHIWREMIWQSFWRLHSSCKWLLLSSSKSGFFHNTSCLDYRKYQDFDLFSFWEVWWDVDDRKPGRRKRTFGSAFFSFFCWDYLCGWLLRVLLVNVHGKGVKILDETQYWLVEIGLTHVNEVGWLQRLSRCCITDFRVHKSGCGKGIIVGFWVWTWLCKYMESSCGFLWFSFCWFGCSDCFLQQLNESLINFNVIKI